MEIRAYLLVLLHLAFGSSLSLSQTRIEKETLTYAIKDGKELRLDKYVDTGIQTTEKRPVMIYVHGGGFAMGSSKNALQIKYNKHFAAKGFISVSINYRLGITPGKQPDNETINSAVSIASEDLINATAFILSKAEEWNINTKKIIISGGSAGAITCLNTEYAICTYGAFSDKLPKDFNYAGLISHAGNVVIPQDTLIWKKAPCPMLLMHGSVDQLVTFNSVKHSNTLYAGSNYIHKQLEQMDIPHWLYEETGADHIVALKPLQHNFGEIDTFIDKFIMKKTHAIVHTQWKDKVPDSMADMAKVVPLYLAGWEKTDEEVEKK